MSAATLATVENMARVAESCPRAVAYSPSTGEQFSATPNDYFWLGAGEAIIDSEGEPCVLAVRSECFEDALTGEAI